ncbi:MAG TPA: M48 family metallopeptidase [Bacteroidales bacterium]|nr:M48 family metallopeptidase [Bacteroidales bacterium]
MGQQLLYIITGILVFDFILERVLEYLNARHFSPKLPDALKDIYDPEKYRNSQLYFRDNQRFGLLTSTISFIAILLMLYLSGFAYLDSFVREITTNPVLMALLFFGILGLASDILSLPFQLYDTFVIEEKYGFNKTTPKTFITDKLKGYLLAAIIGGGLLALMTWVYQLTGQWFGLIVWWILILFTLFMTMFYASVIVPLFNKLTPLKEGELRSEIERFAENAGFDLKNIYLMDGSKRSTKANAFFSGLGKKKKIVLFDTLVNDHSAEEVVAVLAHEIGHYQKKHTKINFAMAIVQITIMISILSFFLNPETLWPTFLANALGAKNASFHLGILAFGMLYAPLSLIIGIISNVISRKFEYQADRFAAENYSAQPLQNALKKMSVNHLSNLQPHPAYVFVHYSHPPLLKRLHAMDDYTEN